MVKSGDNILKSYYRHSAENKVYGKGLTPPVASNDLFVMAGDNILVSCQTNYSLSYCSLMSPTGVYHVGISKLFSYGSCTILVSNVSNLHHGVWECQMGLPHQEIPLTVPVRVTITSSPIFAVNPDITAPIGSTRTLECQSVLIYNVTGLDLPKPVRSDLGYCWFIRPDGKTISFKDVEKDVDLLKYRPFGVGLSRGSCGMQIKGVRTVDNGNWTCAVGVKRQQHAQASINVRVHSSSEVYPSVVTVNEGEAILLKLRDQDTKLRDCLIRMPGRTAESQLTDEATLGLSYWGTGLDKGQCGARLDTSSTLVLRNEQQLWTLTAVDVDGVITSGIAQITILRNEAKSLATEVRVSNFFLGEMGTVNCELPGYEYCVIVPPGGEVRDYTSGDCIQELKPVTSADLGKWKCIVGVSSKPEEVEQDVVVQAEELRLDAGFKHVDHGAVELFCTAGVELEFCRFTSPDGTVLPMADGFLVGDYVYSGLGLKAGHCGVLIGQPRDSDYGSWRCDVGPHDRFHGGFINVTRLPYAVDARPTVATRDVSAVVNTPLTLSCHVHASLQYCWFLHPNGKHLVATPDVSVSGYHYAGQGLDVGDCSVTLDMAQVTDSGVWRCHMSVNSTAGEDIVNVIRVKIAVTPLVASMTPIETSGSKATILSCESIPQGRGLEYCSFQRPDTKRFMLGATSDLVLDRYLYHGAGLDKGECGLQITSIASEDIGQWTCAALVEGNAREASDSIHLDQPGLSAGLIGGISVAGAVLLAVAGYAAIKSIRRKRRNSIGQISIRSDGSSNTNSQESTVDPEGIEMEVVGQDSSSVLQ